MHKLLTPKTAMDAVNEQLLDPSEWHYPGVDKEYYSPFFYKGTESKDEQIERRSSLVTAEIKQHTDPRVLPPRNELRSHLDEEVKKELALEKEGSRSIRLTAHQDKFWSGAFAKFSKPKFRMSEDKALRMADRETIRHWPELARYSRWTDPRP
jgi:hypothetical protein